jgi:hypothetical protein
VRGATSRPFRDLGQIEPRGPVARFSRDPRGVSVRFRVLAWWEVAARLVRRSRSALRRVSMRRSRLAVFPRHPSPIRLVVVRAILSCGSVSFRVLLRSTCLRTCGGASPGVRSPSAPSKPPATSPEVPPSSTAHVHGFSPSSRAFFRLLLPGPVSSRKHSWGSPFRGFPSDVAPLGSSPRDPLVSFPRWPPGSSAWCLGSRASEDLGRLQGFSHRPSPFALARSVRPRQGRSPPGLLPP